MGTYVAILLSSVQVLLHIKCEHNQSFVGELELTASSWRTERVSSEFLYYASRQEEKKNGYWVKMTELARSRIPWAVTVVGAPHLRHVVPLEVVDIDIERWEGVTNDHLRWRCDLHHRGEGCSKEKKTTRQHRGRSPFYSFDQIHYLLHKLQKSGCWGEACSKERKQHKQHRERVSSHASVAIEAVTPYVSLSGHNRYCAAISRWGITLGTQIYDLSRSIDNIHILFSKIKRRLFF